MKFFGLALPVKTHYIKWLNKTAIIICFSFLISDTASAQVNCRKVLLFAPSLKDQKLLKQQAIFQSDQQGIKERDLKIQSIIFSASQEQLFRKYNASATSFTFILIGKDGGEKLRRERAIGLDELYSVIDAMPMRKIEMRKGKEF